MINFFYKKGVSFLEIMMAMAVLSIIIAIVLPQLSGFRNQQILKNTTEDIVSFLNKARTQTISSLNSSQYGVHFQSDKMILFTGSTYNQFASSNEVIIFDNHIQIPTTNGINLNGSGADVIFNRLSGDTNKYGTIVIQLISDVSKSKTISISSTGIISSN